MKSIKKFATTHKFWSAIIVLVVVVGAYYIYNKASTANILPQYSLAFVHTGKISQTVTGSGQVSASNQTDILAQGSGSITSINAKVGQEVKAGQLIATIDSASAAITLRNAQLSLAKLTEPAKVTDISNAQANIVKAYNDGFNAAANIYLDLPTIMAGMKDLLYGLNGYLSDQNSSQLDTTSIDNIHQAGIAYDRALAEYNNGLQEFHGLSRTSATSSIDTLLNDTYLMIKDVSQAATLAQNAVTYIATNQPGYKTGIASGAAANTKTWASTANSDLGALVSAQNSISSNTNSLTTLTTGADQFDLQQAQLNLRQAEQTYNNYFIRAPYDGTIGRIPVNVYGQAGASTVIATIVGNQKIATISLNEVDAAKVADGQSVMITFDAIDGLDATGTVEQVDQVGTVSSGVVSYGVKILINTADDRIKPGMSVNTSIITKEDDNVLVVPSSAVKKQGNQYYVQTLPRSVLATLASSTTNSAPGIYNGQFASSTRRGQFGSTTNNFAGTSNNSTFGSSTRGTFGSSTRSRNFVGSGIGGANRTMAISSALTPTQVPVTVGDSDDTNTQILSGLNPGTLVITKTTTGTAAQTTSAPSILNTLGGGRGGAGGGAFRAGGGAVRGN